MNAIQQPRPPLQSVAPRRRMATRGRQQPRHHPHGAMAIETTAKLFVNVVLSAAAIAALGQLLPYHLSQQAKLSEIKSEVKAAEKRVAHLRSDFIRYNDPQLAKTLMQEQSHRVDPSQRPVVLIDKGATDEEQPAPPNP